MQTLQAGSFDDEATLLARMDHEFIPLHGLRIIDNHHAIYLCGAPHCSRDATAHPATAGRIVLRKNERVLPRE